MQQQIRAAGYRRAADHEIGRAAGGIERVGLLGVNGAVGDRDASCLSRIQLRQHAGGTGALRGDGAAIEDLQGAATGPDGCPGGVCPARRDIAVLQRGPTAAVDLNAPAA
jgi:hypothetical protein